MGNKTENLEELDENLLNSLMEFEFDDIDLSIEFPDLVLEEAAELDLIKVNSIKAAIERGDIVINSAQIVKNLLYYDKLLS